MSLIPPELLQLVTEFKSFVSQQKTIREENCSQRFQITPIVAIEKELEEGVVSALHKIELDLQSKAKLVNSLRVNTEQLMKDADLAHRLLKTGEIGFNPSFGMVGGAENHQLANPTAKSYFMRVIEQFESQMRAYSARIKDLEQQLNNLNKPCTPEELILTMKKQHEALIALAAEVYMVHEEIAKLKKHMEAGGGNQTTTANDIENRIKSWGN